MLALWIALRVRVASAPYAEIAWIHLVALGWVTVSALSILLHAIPAFLDVTWRNETLARYALAATAAAIAALVIAFLLLPAALGITATILLGALIIYLVTAWATLAQASRSEDRSDRAVARAFAVTLALLAIAALLGTLIAWMLAGAQVPAWIAQLPPAHANLALFGWLTLLIYGVSARTLRPITGNRTRRLALHVIAGTTTLLGAPLLALGSPLAASWLLWLGGALVAAGAAAYVLDVAVLLAGASEAHRVPQAFVAAGIAWLGAAMVLGAGVLAGAPWQLAFVFVMLAGWVGQFVNAHVFHIGVRLIATIYRGDDDETRPQELLDPRWSWCVFIAFQIAVAAIAAGLVLDNPPIAIGGAAAGLFGWLAMITTLGRARIAAMNLRAV